MYAHEGTCARLPVFVSMGLFCVYLNVLVIMYFHVYFIHPCVSVCVSRSVYVKCSCIPVLCYLGSV